MMMIMNGLTKHKGRKSTLKKQKKKNWTWTGNDKKNYQFGSIV